MNKRSLVSYSSDIRYIYLNDKNFLPDVKFLELNFSSFSVQMPHCAVTNYWLFYLQELYEGVTMPRGLLVAMLLSAIITEVCLCLGYFVELVNTTVHVRGVMGLNFEYLHCK